MGDNVEQDLRCLVVLKVLARDRVIEFLCSEKQTKIVKKYIFKIQGQIPL